MSKLNIIGYVAFPSTIACLRLQREQNFEYFHENEAQNWQMFISSPTHHIIIKTKTQFPKIPPQANRCIFFHH